MPLSKITTTGIADDAVTTAKILDDAVTGAKIPAGAVVADIADGGITTAKLADDAVSSAKIADDAVTTPKIAQYRGRRNLVINGDMRISQRNTSETGITNTTSFVIDRFQMQNNASYTTTVEQETLTSGGAYDSGFLNALKITWTTGADSSTGNYSLTNYNIEKQDMDYLLQGTSNAKNIVISFWVKSSVTGDHSLTLQNYASSRRSNVLSYNISAANTWEYKTIATSVDTTASTESANGKGLSVRFGHAAGSSYEATDATTGFQTADYFGFSGAAYPGETTNATWHITGLQIEEGTQATSFEHRYYQEELRACQRYCYFLANLSSGSTGDNFVFLGRGNGNSSLRVPLMTAVPLRASPTIYNLGGSGYRVKRGDSGTTVGDTSNTMTVQFFSPDSNHLCGVVNISGATDNKVFGLTPLSSTQWYLDSEL